MRQVELDSAFDEWCKSNHADRYDTVLRRAFKAGHERGYSDATMKIVQNALDRRKSHTVETAIGPVLDVYDRNRGV